MSQPAKKLALVLSGGGARGAYEAGIIHYIRTQLPPAIARRNFDILCGSSVGAINTCFLAASSHNLDYQGRKVVELWEQLKQNDIYLRGVGTMTRFMGRTAAGMMRNILGIKPSHKMGVPTFKGMFDTAPFHRFLRKVIPWKQITLNIQNRLLGALSITATNVHSGRAEFFIDKNDSIIYTGRYLAHFVNLEPVHAIASAAIPLLFPATRIGKSYYCDGGLRLNTPLSPAIQLGADKVLVIGLHHVTERAETDKPSVPVNYDVPPTMGEIMGQVLKSVFLDRLDNDLAQLNRINLVIQTGREAFGEDFVTRMNTLLHAKGIGKDIGARGLKELKVMSIFPSQDIPEIFAECMKSENFMKRHLSGFEKVLLKLLDVDLEYGMDFLTFVLFLPAYLKRLLNLGYEDARSNHDKLMEFFEE